MKIPKSNFMLKAHKNTLNRLHKLWLEINMYQVKPLKDINLYNHNSKILSHLDLLEFLKVPINLYYNLANK